MRALLMARTALIARTMLLTPIRAFREMTLAERSRVPPAPAALLSPQTPDGRNASGTCEGMVEILDPRRDESIMPTEFLLKRLRMDRLNPLSLAAPRRDSQPLVRSFILFRDTQR